MANEEIKRENRTSKVLETAKKNAVKTSYHLTGDIKKREGRKRDDTSSKNSIHKKR